MIVRTLDLQKPSWTCVNINHCKVAKNNDGKSRYQHNEIKAHSTRSAATFKATSKGMSVQQITHAANWFYNKQIESTSNDTSSHSSFANLVLS